MSPYLPREFHGATWKNFSEAPTSCGYLSNQRSRGKSNGFWLLSLISHNIGAYSGGTQRRTAAPFDETLSN